MPHRLVTIASSVGLHARPAAIFAKAAGATGVPITIARPGADGVNAASLLSVMGLGLSHGEQVELSSDDPASESALDELAALLATDLDQGAGA